MRLLALKGDFGNLNGKTISFVDGFSLHMLENGSGKSTICALLRVMLYGLRTARKGDANDDRTRYQPADGTPMAGYLTLMWNRRQLLISRTTGKNGPMQDFQAVYTDTGERCALFTAKNCGQVLLGLSEEAFLSSAFVDGADIARPSGALQELVSAMAQSGDTQGYYFESMRQLGRWKLDFDSGNGTGEKAAIQLRLQQAQVQLQDQHLLQSQLATHKNAVEQFTAQYAQAEMEYEQAYQAFARQMASDGGISVGLVRDYDQRITKLEQSVLDNESMSRLEENLMTYEAASRLEQEKRADLTDDQLVFEQYMQQLEEDQAAYQKQLADEEKPGVRWFPLSLGIVFSAMTASAWVYLESVSLDVALALCAVMCIVWAFSGMVRKREDVFDFEGARTEMKLSHQSAVDDHRMAQEVLLEAEQALLESVASMDATLHVDRLTTRQALDRIATYQQTAAIVTHLKEERSSLLVARQLGVVEEDKSPAEEKADALRQQMMQLREKLRDAETELARVQAYCRPDGSVAELEANVEKLNKRSADIDRRMHAIQLAADVLQAEHKQLAEKMSPQIIEVASAFLSYLTDEAYKAVQVDAQLRAVAVDANGRVWQAGQLSAGTYDQVYLSVRLAVCTVLSGANHVPIILDDPFTTFDAVRTERGLELLQHLASKRQVIAFTCRV